MGLSAGTVITELEAHCAPHLMLPLSSKYGALHAFKGKTHLMHAKLYVNRMSVYIATWPQLLHCQQEFLHRTSLESQKLSLMGEVSYLKLKLSDMEGKQGYGAERQHKAEVGLLTHASVWKVLF